MLRSARTPWSTGSWPSAKSAEIAAVELIGAEGHAILHAQGAGLIAVEDLPLPDGIYNLFTIEDGKVTRIVAFAERGKALIAAGLAAAAM